MTKSRPQIDVEEFERYLRETTKAPLPQEDDPLAELARLVSNSRDPYDDVFSRGGEGASSQGFTESRHPAIDFAAIEAGLRGSLPGHEGDQTHAAELYPQEAYNDGNQGYYDPQGAALPAEQQTWEQSGPAARSYPAQRSRRPVYAMVAVILVGVVGIGIAFAYKGKNSGPREVAMIKAVPGPAKIQPPADASADQPAHDGSVLDNSQQPAPTKTETHAEQPVDLAENVPTPSREAAAGITPIYNFGVSGPNADSAAPAIGASSAPPPVSSDTRGVAGDMQPIRVKTRSYRPDGTPIPNDHIPAAAIDSAAAAPAPVKTPAAAVAKASTPKAQAPAKTTTRAAPAAKPAVSPSVATSKPAVAAKPIVTAARDPDAPTDLTPTNARPVRPVRPAKPVKIADAAEDGVPQSAALATESGGGGFTVQLAAPGSEAEAKQTSARLEQKFASELDGHRLATYKAVSNGKTVYRVRAGRMTREQATGLCDKLKASGGSCFIAKN
ncbi:MAG: SPOR domain-containing protein [Beijerinckiaceae bacterium]|nr:SPOR domain-containing protein [Beijerinckiaceae bacterium]